MAKDLKQTVKRLSGLFLTILTLSACSETLTSVNGTPPGSSVPFNLQQTQRLQGTWSFVYTIMSTWTDTYALQRTEESTVTVGEYVIWGTDQYGETVIAGYSPDLEAFSLLDTGSVIDQFYVFDFTSADQVSGCYYLIDLSTERWSDCYTMLGSRLGSTNFLTAQDNGSRPNPRPSNKLKETTATLSTTTNDPVHRSLRQLYTDLKTRRR